MLWEVKRSVFKYESAVHYSYAQHFSTECFEACFTNFVYGLSKAADRPLQETEPACYFLIPRVLFYFFRVNVYLTLWNREEQVILS